jgi:uracil-DNA glycosylase
MNNDKWQQYHNLVLERKACRKCSQYGLRNPSTLFDGDKCLDSDEIDGWALWQNSLDADVLLLGQEWGDVNGYIGDALNLNSVWSATNDNLIELFKSIGIDVQPPTSHVKNKRLFFTNAALCLKENGGAQGETNNLCYRNCERFIKELIDIIQPKIVITLGFHAYDAIVEAYNLNLPGYNTFSEVINRSGDGIKIRDSASTGDILLFPVYHPACRIINLGNKHNGRRYRSWEQMLNDWKRIEKYLPGSTESNAYVSDFQPCKSKEKKVSGYSSSKKLTDYV